MQDLRLDAAHSHLYPGARGQVSGSLPDGGKKAPCQVAFADGAMALATLVMASDGAAVLETGPYTTAAGTEVPAKRWRLEIGERTADPRPFRVRAKLPLD